MSDPGEWLGTELQIAHVPLRATVLLLLAFAGALLLRRKAASLRHRLWVITFVALLLLPVPALLLLAGVGSFPGLRLELLPALQVAPPRSTIVDPGPLLANQGRSIRHLTVSWRRPASEAETLRNHGLMPPGATPATARDRSPISPLGGTLAVVWLIGVGVVLARAGLARRRARSLVRLSQPADVDLWPGTAGVPARETDAVDLPITVGALRPVILLPRGGRDWPLAWRRSAVAHEVAHLRRQDPLWQLLAELATALHWYHPLAWAAARRLRIERELAADDDVLLQGNRGSDYAQLLVTLACAPDAPVAAGAVLPLLTPAGLKARLLGILNPARIRHAPRAWLFLLGLASALALVPVAAALPVRALRPAATASPVGQYVVGRVIDGATGQPLGGVEVDFLIAHRVLRTTTAADGRIHSPLPGDGPPQEMFNLYARQGSLAARKTVLAVKYGTELPLELRLNPGRRLSGTVTSADGRPVAGARLNIIDWQTHAVGPGGGELARTDADGSFVIEGLLYGDYSLLAVAPGGLAVLHRLPVGEVDPPPAVLRLPDPKQVTARLRDEDGRPLAGVRVERAPRLTMYPRGRTGERHVDWDVSGADGSVRLLPLGEPLVASATDAHGQVIEALFTDGGVSRWMIPTAAFDRVKFTTRDHQFGQPRTDRFVLLQRPAVLNVRVEDPEGRPVPRVRLQVDPASDDPSWAFRARSPTDGDGRIPGIAVPPGSVVIAVTPRGMQRPSIREILSVKAGEQKQVRLVVPAGFSGQN